MTQRDEVKPEGRWEFDDGVTEVFDDMLQRSIPEYEGMRDAVHELALLEVRHRSASDVPTILDLGASRGAQSAQLIQSLGAQARFHLVETSKPMLTVLRERFKGWIQTEVVFVHDFDLRTDWMAPPPVWVTMAILTLQFIPLEHRQQVVRNVRESMRPGGVFLVVEKVLGNDSVFNDRFVHLYNKLKRDHGYSEDDVVRKAMALEGVLVPQSAEANERMLKAEGFKVDCFWRWMNFAGWVARA